MNIEYEHEEHIQEHIQEHIANMNIKSTSNMNIKSTSREHQLANRTQRPILRLFSRRYTCIKTCIELEHRGHVEVGKRSLFLRTLRCNDCNAFESAFGSPQIASDEKRKIITFWSVGVEASASVGSAVASGGNASRFLGEDLRTSLSAGGSPPSAACHIGSCAD